MVNNDAVVRTSYYKYFHPKVMVVVMVVVVMVVVGMEVVGMEVMVVEVVILMVVLRILVLNFLLVTARAVAILFMMTSTLMRRSASSRTEFSTEQ